jgi:uncharacterized protein YjbI with pentapeptide repeats
LETQPPPEGHPATGASEAAPIDVWPTPAVSPVAGKTDDFETAKKAIEDAASVAGGLWLSYLGFLFYFAISAGAVTHADLFFEKPVKLPFLNVDLPLLAFFFVGPILFLIVHAYTLAHLALLADKVEGFHIALSKQIRIKGVTEVEKKHSLKIRTGLRRQFPSNIFVQFLAGPADVREGAFGWLLQAIIWLPLVVAPVLLLLLFQIQFLPYHSSFITWTHRIVLLLDMALLWWLWPNILSGHAVGERRRLSSTASAVALAVSFGVFLFSWTAATFPGELLEVPWPEGAVFENSNELLRPTTVSLHDWVFNSTVDPTTRRRRLPLSSTLVLTGLNVYEGLGIDDPEKIKGREFVFRARGRDLKGAILDLAILPKVDFTGAEFQGASLSDAQLQRASLTGAELQGASLDRAQLQDASLDGAQLQRASLEVAHLKGASLDGALLQGAFLLGAQLQGASLRHSKLHGASLDGAQLQGASLEEAQLQGALLARAQLQGASLYGANLRGASLERAQLQGAELKAAKLEGASLQLAILDATDLSYAFLWRTNRKPLASSKVTTIRLRGAMWRPSNKPSFPPPPEADAWRKALEDARADDAAYAKALAEAFQALVCSGGDDAAYVLRGLSRAFLSLRAPFSRLGAAGPETPTLVDFIMSKECPLSPSLTADDKAKLLRIKEDAINPPRDQ